MSGLDVIVLAAIGMVPVVLFAIAKMLRSGSAPEPVMAVRYEPSRGDQGAEAAQPADAGPWGQAERMQSAWDEQPCPASVCMLNRNSLMTGGYGSEVRSLGYGGQSEGEIASRGLPLQGSQGSAMTDVERDNELSHYQRIGGRRAAPPRLVEPETVPYFSYAAMQQEAQARLDAQRRRALPEPGGDVVDGEWREATNKQPVVQRRLGDGRGRR